MVISADPERLGGIGWVRRTGGRLTAPERRRLLAAIVRGQATNLLGRIRLLTGWGLSRDAGFRLGDISVPDSRLAREAEEAWRQQPAAIATHAQRTWVFGAALALVDDAKPDPELLYVACLLHDAGLERTVVGEDFTIRSADIAAGCAARAAESPERSEVVQDAIAVHTTPGIEAERDGVLGYYVQAGALVDLGGFRLWDLNRELVEETLDAHPRHGLKREILELIEAEAAAVPDGRFALLARWGFPLAVRIAPYGE